MMTLTTITRAALALPESERRTLRARISTSLRRTTANGARATCDCGECKTCRKREQMRRYRAKLAG